ncbi:MAG: multidrug efflux SMR transporter [Methanomassiliicoccaceae archaeon]|nr:multidrug efflux SMR transporter [Methanomassiliicoccaceae archaeon]
MLSLAWICLIAAGLLEPCWAISLKRSERFRNIRWGIATVVFLTGSLYLLSYSMITLPAGTAYAVWTGVGAVGTLAAGALVFREKATSVKIFFVLLIIAGIVGFQITGGV